MGACHRHKVYGLRFMIPVTEKKAVILLVTGILGETIQEIFIFSFFVDTGETG